MSTVIRPAGSEYNKNTEFAVFALDPNSSKLKFSEAIAYGSDDVIRVYAYITDAPSSTDYSKGFTFSPMVGYFDILKKDLGEKKKTSPSMQFMAAQIEAYGLEKPFSGLIDLGMPESFITVITSGKNDDGTPLAEVQIKMLRDTFVQLSPIEKLEQLEGKTMKAPSGGSGFSKGGGGQKEIDRLRDRLAFLKECNQHDSEWRKLAKELGFDEAEQQSFIGSALAAVLNF